MALTIQYRGGNIEIPDYVPGISSNVTPLANINYVGTNWPPGPYNFAQVSNVSNIQGYGGYVQQALLSLTENFATTSNSAANVDAAGPANVIFGQLWADANITASLANVTFTNRSNVTLRISRETQGANAKTATTWREIPLQNDRHVASDLFVDSRGGNSNVANYISANNLANANIQVWGNGTIVLTGNTASATSNTGYLNTGNINVRGFVTSNLLPNANNTYNLGSSAYRWKDIWLTNSTIYIGNGNISNPNANTILVNSGLEVVGDGGFRVDAGASGNIIFENAANFNIQTIENINLSANDSLIVNVANTIDVTSNGNYTLTSNASIAVSSNVGYRIQSNNVAIAANSNIQFTGNTLTANINGNTSINSINVNIASNSNAGGTTNISGGPVNVSNTITVGSGANTTTIHASNGSIIASNIVSTDGAISGNLQTNQLFIGNGNIIAAYANGLVTIGLGSNQITLNGNTGTVNTANANAEVTARGSQWAIQFNSGNATDGILTGSDNFIWNNSSNSLSVNGSANVRGITTFGSNVTVEGTNSFTTREITTGDAVILGNITGQWTLSPGSTLQSTYADLAERYISDSDYPIGTVLVFGGAQEVTQSTHTADHRVAGVISNAAAYIMNSNLENSVVVALRGRVPVLVNGPVKKGDLLITSSVAGHAQSVGSDASYGCKIFAKSLEEDASMGTKMIEAVIL